MADEWLGTNGKANFRYWFKSGFYVIGDEQIDIDKDIKHPKNKIYGSDTCLIVPHVINVAIDRCYREPAHIKSEDKWRAEIDINGKHEILGLFSTKEEADRYYIDVKRAYYYAMADIYKDKIPEEVYRAVIDYICNDNNYQSKEHIKN
jgi:hypothetical protein